jgi:hypothetical protein
MTEEQKAKMKAGRDAKKLEVVSVEDFNSFKEETKKTNETILNALESLLNKDPKKEILEPVEEKTESEIVPLTAKQKEVFDYYFAETDGFTSWYDINKNIFTIEVPMALSNTTPAYRALYKRDLRSKKVDSNDILGSIKAWCILVAQNLKYEKRIRLK